MALAQASKKMLTFAIDKNGQRICSVDDDFAQNLILKISAPSDSQPSIQLFASGTKATGEEQDVDFEWSDAPLFLAHGDEVRVQDPQIPEASVDDEARKEVKANGGRILSCAFCSKEHREVRKLILGPHAAICNECVELCCDILEEEASSDSANK